jgi:hypothetical protein
VAGIRQYYALCIASPHHDSRISRSHFALEDSDIALIDIGFDKELHSTIRAVALYTSEEGHAQQHDLETYSGTEIRPVSREHLRNVITPGVPSSVFIDGEKMAASVFKRRLL